MKRMFALVLALMLFLSACEGTESTVKAKKKTQREDRETKSQQAEQEDVPAEKTEYAEREEAAEQEETRPTYYAATVEDQYVEVFTNPYLPEMRYCVHIPTIFWNGQECELLREQIYQDHWRKIASNTAENQTAYAVAYSLGQGEGVASLITVFEDQQIEYSSYSLFHVDLATGQEATDDQVLAAFGYTEEQFFAEVRQILETQFKESYGKRDDGFSESQAYQNMLAEQTADELIKEARPYVDEAGKLCALTTRITPAGAGRYPGRICLQSADAQPTPQKIMCNQNH